MQCDVCQTNRGVTEIGINTGYGNLKHLHRLCFNCGDNVRRYLEIAKEGSISLSAHGTLVLSKLQNLDEKRESEEAFIERYLKLPYPRVVVPCGPDEKGYFCEVLGMSGCYSQGEGKEEAINNIEEAMRSWLAAMYHLARDVPAPPDMRKIVKLLDRG